MTLRHALEVLRRWRWIVAVGGLVGVVVGWVLAPDIPAATTYEATHTLIFEPGLSGTDMRQAAVVAEQGAVPDRVAARLGAEPVSPGNMVTAETPPAKGTLLITGQSFDPEQAEALANLTAEELIVELGDEAAPVRTLEPAVAEPVDSGDVRGPSSSPGRALLLGGFGLVLGVGAAFVVERFDDRIRSKGAAEEALGVPVIAEVPPIRRPEQGRLLTGSEAPPVVEAYRSLRAVVARWAPPDEHDDGHRIIVVTSAGAGEGKTTTVAHLAAAFAESGRSVLAISADLRRPELHRYFDRPRDPGLVDVLSGNSPAGTLADLDVATAIPGVHLVASGPPVGNPAPLLEQVGDFLHAAGKMTDVVLVDSPPLLTAADAAQLARHADGVLLVLRAGRTSTGGAAASIEQLRRLGIPIIGAVLVASGRTGRPEA